MGLRRSIARWWSRPHEGSGSADLTDHFSRDYNRHVARLQKSSSSLDEAMSLAVGGNFSAIGQIHSDLLKLVGLRDGMKLLDLGCGSGRTAVTIARDFNIDYHGVDVVQQLLDYARAHSPQHYRYSHVTKIQIPDSDACADMVCAFSLFTHLLHEETYRYLEECRRVLKPGGKLVFSFLEFAMPYHWHVFAGTVNESKMSARTHLNVFIERPAIQAWSEHLGFSIELWQDSNAGARIPLSRPVVTDTGETLEHGANLGQSVCVMRKL